MLGSCGALPRCGQLAAIHTLADQAHACRGERPATVVRCLELDNLVLVAEAIALAALTRQEPWYALSGRVPRERRYALAL